MSPMNENAGSRELSCICSNGASAPVTASVRATTSVSSAGLKSARADAPGDSTHLSLTVLLAEDEPVIRTLLTRQLQADGHSVIAAEDGAYALQLATTYGGEIHVLVTDIVMPKMGGAELANALQQERPETRIIYMSGYAPDAALRDGLMAENLTFLSKPFSYTDLRSVLWTESHRPRPYSRI